MAIQGNQFKLSLIIVPAAITICVYPTQNQYKWHNIKLAPWSFGVNSNSLDLDSGELQCQLEYTILVVYINGICVFLVFSISNSICLNLLYDSYLFLRN